ncbi:hypothetical protein VTN00DRAFT_9290 [Thermoascus crustaceus]|uniref:uncharacterized protein n=1 Tax=Thermoascus crustaceus TaxID=5088 RepID=UPI0037420E74
MGLFSLFSGSPPPPPPPSWNPLSWGGSSKPAPSGVTSFLSGSSDKAPQWFQNVLGKFGFTGAIATILSFLLYFLYLKFVKKDSHVLSTFVKQIISWFISKIPGLNKIPFLNKFLSVPGVSKALIPKGTQSALASIKGTGGGVLSKLNPFKWNIFHKRRLAEEEDDEKYQAGEPYGDPKALAPSLVDDLKAVGLKGGVKDIQTLLQAAKTKGKPADDREMLMEKMIAIAASLPRNSKAREKLTGLMIDTLWQSLQHPPLSYLGNKYQYRTPDGSYNNPLQPDLGKAGSPYARTVARKKHLHGVPPDPGLLFDLLMARTDDSFKENPAGISSMLFYHATIIIHDIFRTNRFDNTISDTSSYLDLAPLYGSSREDQLKIRTMQGGKLKPDTFHEKRLLGQPPGVNVILVMYSRFHNYVADVLLKINEGGRFSLPPTRTEEERQKALAKQDEDLFQTARLVVGGMYINISLHDYIRGITNVHHSKSDWTLDPRVVVNRHFDPEGVPRGIGNQVSAEFNLLYRFHAVISRRDEKWMNEFFQSLFPDLDKPLDQLTPQEFIQGLFRYEQSIPEDPGKREFGGLKRDETGRFNDADLVKILKESMEDPAGIFGARMVPKALKIIEVTGILTARKWQLASLNEMREFFKLQRHETFEDINPDPEIADLLRKMYDHPDMVEMYPGLFLEDIKPRMDPGFGVSAPYTVGRAVLSDAVTLVRSDRFYTLDYTASNLTNWGMEEVQEDYRILGGSMFYKLIQRTLPGWFPYNSLHVMQPMYTRKMNEQIARELGTIDQYTLKDPSPPPKPIIVPKYSTITKVLNDQANFHVPWAIYLNDMIPGKDYSSYMLCGDKPSNTAQRNLVGDILFSPTEFKQLLSETAMSVGRELLKTETLSLKKDLHQVDIIRDVAIPLNTRLLADLFSMDLKTPENPNGSLNTATLYKYLMDVRVWGFSNNDPALAWKRRMAAREGAEALTETTLKLIKATPRETAAKGITSGIKGLASKVPVVGGLFKGGSNSSTTGSLRWYGYNVVRELIAAGKSPEETAEICWATALGGVGASISVFADVLSFFFRKENVHLWEQVQNLALSSNIESADKTLRQYVLEAQRLTSSQADLRICVGKTTIDGQTFEPGHPVITLIANACRDPEVVPDPGTFKLDRPPSAYIHFGYGPHACLGREIALTYIISMLRIVAELKNARPAPGHMGELKSITMGNEKLYLNDSWSYLTIDPTTWKLHFEGYGKGVFQPPAIPVTAGQDLNALSNALIKQAQEGVKGAVSHANGTYANGAQSNGHPNGPANGSATPAPAADDQNEEKAKAKVPPQNQEPGNADAQKQKAGGQAQNGGQNGHHNGHFNPIKQVITTAGNVVNTAAHVPGAALNVADGVTHGVVDHAKDVPIVGNAAGKAFDAVDGIAHGILGGHQGNGGGLFHP